MTCIKTKKNLFLLFLNADEVVFDESFFDQLPEIGPHVSLFALPHLTNPPQQAPRPQGGRLLTPAEGCGQAKVFNSRIVGGAPATPGNYLSTEFDVIFELNNNFELAFRSISLVSLTRVQK